MERTARALAGYGRHGDNNLLHVSDQELRGIELLSGKKFTRNPDTGLPEAFNWSSLIPVAAGIAGTVLSGGNPLVGAAAAGATSAGKAKIEGKSNEQALTQGLISGVTSYAGGSLLGEAANIGAAEAASQGTMLGPAVPDAAAQAANQSAAAAPIPAEVAATTPGLPPPAGGMPQIPASMQPGVPSAPSYEEALKSIEAGQAAKVAQPSFSERLSNIGTAVSERPGEVGKAFLSPKGAIAAAGAYSTAMDMFGPPKMPGEIPYDPSKYPEQFPVNPRTWNAPPVGYQPGYSPEYRYFAKGGLADLRKEDGVTANVMNEAKAALLGEHPRPSEALGRFRNMFGEDALDVLRDKVTGGRVRGAGGGMDDLVPGTIEGRQQVRLADGEFVVPADVVSGLGDGSTDQGVRRLHEMMKNVRQQRTGKAAQPKAIGGKISL